MPRNTESFTSASVTASSSLSINRVLTSSAANLFKVFKLIITPSIAGTNMKVEIYKRDTFAASTRCYNTLNFNGPLVEPMEDIGSGPVERNEGFVFVYEDLDATGELHIKIFNNHTLAMTYAVTMVYEPDFSASTGITISTAGAISQTAESVVQKVRARINTGTAYGQPQLNFIEGSNITLTIVNDTTNNEVDITIAGAGASNKTRLLEFSDIYEVISGNPIETTHDNLLIVGLPTDANCEIAVTFRVPEDYVESQDAFLALNFAADEAPGVTNNKVKIQIKHKVNSGSFSSYVGDTITLSDNTNWAEFMGTSAKIAASTVTAGDLITVYIKRDVSVANDAAVLFQIRFYGLEYVSEQ